MAHMTPQSLRRVEEEQEEDDVRNAVSYPSGSKQQSRQPHEAKQHDQKYSHHLHHDHQSYRYHHHRHHEDMIRGRTLGLGSHL